MKELMSQGLVVGSKEYFDCFVENNLSIASQIEHDVEKGATQNCYIRADNIIRLRREIESSSQAGMDVSLMNMYLDRIESRSEAYLDSVDGRLSIGRSRQSGSPQIPIQGMDELEDALQDLPESLGNAILNMVANHAKNTSKNKQMQIFGMNASPEAIFRANELRDVTDEVNKALGEVVRAAMERRGGFGIVLFPETEWERQDNLAWFIEQVDRNAPWDIKVPRRWVDTIQTDFPGRDVPVNFRGYAMTAEQLGNFTYGYIGAALGLPENVLISGSIAVAIIGSRRNNIMGQIVDEISDWDFIRKGFNAFDASRYNY